MVRSRLAEQLEHARPVLLGGSVLGYPIAYWSVFLLSPGDPRAISAIFVALIAWFGGVRIGIVAGVGLAACNGIVNGIVRRLDVAEILRERLPVILCWLVLAAIVGWISDQLRLQQAERRRAETLLRRTEERHRSVIDSLEEIIFQTDRGGRWTFLNPAWTTVTGFPVAESLGELSFAFLRHDVRRAARADLRALLDGTAPAADEVYELPFLASSGAVRWLEVNRRVLLDDDGRAGGITGTMRDVTARREAREALRRSEEQLRATVEHSAVGFVVVNTDGEMTELNPAFAAMLGYQRDELRGRTFASLTHPDDRDPNLQFHAEMLRGERSYYQMEKRYLHRDGSHVWSRLTVSPVRGATGKVQSTIGVAEDITERKLAEVGLRESEERLRTVVTNAPIALFAIDRREVLTLAEGKGLHLLGLPGGDLSGRTLGEVFGADTAVPAQFRRALSGSAFTAIAELAGLAFEASYVPIRDDQGEISGVIGVATDITARVAYEAQLVHQAHHDPLTGLPNRLLFTRRLDEALQAAREAAAPVALLFLDLDRFKIINDSLGHDRGDQLLITVARRLLDCVRPGDTVARLGGDEFTILLGGFREEAEVTQIAERITRQLQWPFDLDGHEVVVSTSIGVVISRPAEDWESPHDLLRYADLAMYQAKAAGKARYAIFDRSLSAAALARLALEADLRLALERGELAVEYQAQLDLAGGRLAGAEALLRWYHPTRGSVPLGDFIPVAEETGLIIGIGRWMLREACRQAASWRRPGDGLGETPLAVCVNLSAKQFQDPDLCAEIAAVLGETGLPAARLTLEITEGVAMGEVRTTRGTLDTLRTLGVGLAIDDFGTGYSSLGSLKQFPIDTLKIDRTFIGGLGLSDKDDAIVGAVITLGHGLGLRICAEGVETTGQLARLRALGCDLAQGFLFSPALAPAAFETFLDEASHGLLAGVSPLPLPA